MNMKSKAVRRIATAVAALGIVTMSSGAALMVTAGTANADPVSQPNPNHEDHWETLPGEVCVKTDSGANAGNVILPAEPDGRDYSKLIIKKGSGNIGVENQVFDNPVAGAPGYTWVGNDPQQSGGWSHYIVCTVPEPVVEEPEEIAVDVVFTDPTCENENEASFEVTGPGVANVTVETSTPAAPGASVTVTATANDGFVFAGGETEYSESYQFGEAETPCDEDTEPPVVDTPTPEDEDTPDTTVATPTVVHAGLTDAADLRGEQGLALLLAGMLVTLGAGSVVLHSARR